MSCLSIRWLVSLCLVSAAAALVAPTGSAHAQDAATNAAASSAAQEASAAAGPVFIVQIDPAMDLPARSGRIVVYLIDNAVTELRRQKPAEAPFFEAPQPVFGVNVTDLKPGTRVRLDDATATGYPGKLSELPAGSYRVQAVFDWQAESGAWGKEPGNLFSGEARITVEAGKPVVVPLTLTNTVPTPPRPQVAGGQFFEVRSALLSEFRGQEVMLKAGVALPINHDPLAEYAAIYSVPGFGGDRASALREARHRRGLTPGTIEHELARNTFFIVLDPDGPYGHTLLADSANNGPVGRAITEELIPALERRYRLIAKPEARIITGHSSGGWTTLWLATEYPQVFGAAWSSGPDPVDFNAFQKINIYEDQSMFDAIDEDGKRTPHASYTKDGQVLMTIQQEIGVENAIGPRNSSGEQWGSWMAVFGPRAEDGYPAALYDPATGDIDHAIAQQFKRYDITDRLKQNPERFGPIFRNNIRLIMGTRDSYDLHYAVLRLIQTLGEVSPQITAEVTDGYIEMVDGADHSTVRASTIAQQWPAQMLAHLKKYSLLKAAPNEPKNTTPTDAEKKN